MKILWDLYASFFRIGLLTFGGGLAMLPMLKREVVDKYEWITEDEMMDIYAIGQCTPGIIAVNTATFIGYKKGGIMGGIVATLGEITPSLVLILAIASMLTGYMDNPIVLNAFVGIRVVVCSLMFNTVYVMIKKNVNSFLNILLFAIAFALVAFTPISTILVVIGAGIVGIIIDKIAATRNNKEVNK